MGQLEPRAGKGIVERRLVVAEAFRNLAIFGVALERHVGGGHDRRDLLVRVPRVSRHVLRLGVDRRPLVRACRALCEFVVIFEQQAEIVIAPLRRVGGPGPFDTRSGDVTLADFLGVGQPAEAHRVQAFAFGAAAERVRRGCAVALAEGVAASGQRDGFLVVHRHTGEGFAHVAGHALGIVRIAARAFGIDVDQAHLDRRERVFERLALIGDDARLDALVDPLFFRAPIDQFGFEHVLAAAAEAEHRPAHRFDRDIAGEHEQVGPAEVLAVFLLDRPQQAPGLVEIAIVGPAVERGEALLPARGAAAAVAGAIGTRGVPRHADEERAIVPVIRRPPFLAVGHQRGQIALHRSIVERVEGFAIVEIVAHRVGIATTRLEDFDLQLVGPPVAIVATEEVTRAPVATEGAATHLTGFSVHRSSLHLDSENLTDEGMGQSL